MKKLILLTASLYLAGMTFAQTEMLTGGNMEDVSQWQTSLLNTETGAEPTVTWNYTTDAPSAGNGGNLHATGTTTAGNSQYCIYQAVTLSNEMLYTFDGAFKALQINNSWCEVFIGAKPEDGADYGAGVPRLAAFGTWAGYDNADGVFSVNIDAGNYNTFAPDTSGVYYFVLKMGSTSWDGSTQTFEIIVDELSLTEERVAPVVDFTADVTEGYAPLQVQFTDASTFATSWAWDFGDGETSTDQSPAHTFAAVGTYTVTLTASNEIGDTQVAKEGYIVVNELDPLTGGGVLVGANMEDVNLWGTSFLHTEEANQPTVTWNSTDKAPTAGQGGALLVAGLSNNSTVQYCIYQAVMLYTDSVYTFNGAVKDFTENLNQSWIEVFIGGMPIDGVDYSKDDPNNFLLSEFSSWSGECNHKGIDGTFQIHGCGNNDFVPPADGEYYFVLKLGSTSWAGDDMPFELAVDELSLTGSRVAPVVDFEADQAVGFAPLTVQFTDKSSFGNTWAWDFGDGTTSDEQNPSHLYENVGTYTVKLKVSNEIGETELIKEDYVKANELPDLPEGEMLYGGNMEDPNLWNITQLNASAATTATWNFTDDKPAAGEDGVLKISASVVNATSQYCIWQAVELTAGMRYTFTAAFKDVSENLDHFWSEVFIGTAAPADGADYGEGTTKIAFFNTWDCGSSPGLDGTYQDNACGEDPVGVFVPETDGVYYFALKTGCIDWEGNTYAFDVLIDNVSLMETENIPTPVADFFADVTSGDAPLTVNFTDLSQNATSWTWDFGDDNTSTDQHPTHIYTVAGTYSVSLTASNEAGSDTLIVEDLIEVTGATGVEEIANDDLVIYPNPSRGLVHINTNGLPITDLRIYNLKGQEISENISLNYENQIQLNFEKKGIYFISIQTEDQILTKRVVIK